MYFDEQINQIAWLSSKLMFIGHEYGSVHVSLFDVELQTFYTNIRFVCGMIQTDTHFDSGSGGCGCVLVQPGQSSAVATRSLISSTLHTIPQGITGVPIRLII